eukprot:CAMPEP_0205903942 /NCGR_PEP_ID=MMETSP1325-20131115/411_1 /ASSEMBLY_ACC=CAM_ASM_000708 /TAXON_ID=236786 /ORGANISM="Florenciella sp., Strain RCC1007" /LENGTH=79 /DNA_ID=CAMNT_0053269649 /DNA_START=262 /DNA_END=498 /DNA_ORIENTATION=+
MPRKSLAWSLKYWRNTSRNSLDQQYVSACDSKGHWCFWQYATAVSIAPGELMARLLAPAAENLSLSGAGRALKLRARRD